MKICICISMIFRKRNWQTYRSVIFLLKGSLFLSIGVTFAFLIMPCSVHLFIMVVRGLGIRVHAIFKNHALIERNISLERKQKPANIGLHISSNNWSKEKRNIKLTLLLLPLWNNNFTTQEEPLFHWLETFQERLTQAIHQKGLLSDKWSVSQSFT